MKNRFINRKEIGFGISFVVSLLLFAGLAGISGSIIKKQDTQQMAKRWSTEKDVCQVSGFFSKAAGITPEMIVSFEHNLDNSLEEASITSDAANPQARQWADAYSAYGQIAVSSNKTTLTMNAIGVGGDFFYFHPLKLLYGTYFLKEDINKDSCLIDQDAAWQLFGSFDVAGQFLQVGQNVMRISGVIERPAGRMETAAGLSKPIIYVTYEALSNWGTCEEINHYEIVMPDPVNGYAYNLVKEKFGGSEEETVFINNTTRFTFINRLKMYTKASYRSMNQQAIIYPYWENMVRGYEDILCRIAAIMLLLILYPIVGMVCIIVYRFCHRKWNMKSICHVLSIKFAHVKKTICNRTKRKKEVDYEEEI